ncbi:SIS domain-containing protein (plasmid) [Lactobacillus acidophilus]
MSNKIESYLLQTPDFIKKIIGQNINIKLQENYQFIYLVGSGSSYNAAKQVANTMQKIVGSSVDAKYPFEMKEELFLSPSKTLIIGISQSGASVSTYDAMDYAKRVGSATLALTGEPDSYVDKLADYHVFLNIPIEKAGPKTLGYTITKLRLLQLAYFMKGSLLPHEYAILSDQYSLVLNNAKMWFSKHAAELKNCNDIRVIGSSKVYGDTLESALKLLETLRIHVTGYDYEEFIHGIYNSVNENTYLIFLDPKHCSNFDELSYLLNRWTDHIYYFDDIDLLGMQENTVCNNFIFPILAEYISAKLPELKGYDASIPKDKNFHSKMKSKIGEEI